MEEERERLAVDLHDTAGQTLLTILFMAREWAAEAPADSPWAERMSRIAGLARQGRREIHEAIRNLTFVPSLERGLVAAMRDLARSFEADTGISVILDLGDTLPQIQEKTEKALFRVVRQTLANAWRHSRCSAVRLELFIEGRDVKLRITDDGTGLGKRWEEQGPGLGMTGMRRGVESAGGSVRITNIRPHGLRVTASVPVRGNR